MEGQRSTVHSFLEAFEFDNGTSSGSDQQIYGNNLTNPGDSRNLRDYLLSSSDPVNLPFVDPTAHGGSSLNSRSLGINLGQQSVNHPNHDDVKMDEDWTSSLSIHPGASSSLEPRRLEQSEIPPLGSININLHNGLPNMPLHHKNSCPSSALQSSESLTGYVGTDIQPLIDGTSGSIQYKPLASLTGQMLSAGSSSDPGGSSSAMMSDFLDDNGSRSGCSMDERRYSCKRKNFETVSGQSSLGGSSSFQRVEDNIRQILPSRRNSALSIAVPPQNPSSAQSLGEQLHPLASGSSSRLALDCHSSLPVGSDADSSQRNFRMRVNPTYPQESTSSHIWPAANSVRRNGWQPHPSTDRIFSPNRSLDSRSLISSTGSSHNQSNASHLPPGFHQYLQSSRWNGVSIPRIDSSSSSHVASGERSTDLRDARPRTLPRSLPDHLMLPPPLETRHHAQDPDNWSQSSRNLPTDTSSASIAGSSSGPSSSGASWTPGPVAFAHLHRRLSEGRRSFFPSSVSESGSQPSALQPSRSVPATSSAEVVLPPNAGTQRHSHRYLRSAFLMDRPGDGILGVPLSLTNLQAISDGRLRLVSEIQSALDLIRRRGERLRFEDVLILDHPVFYGGADLHDRHRDMRLDVDNMSYEELLALEERIGSVSTGLSEETIMKCLKQSKYNSSANHPSADAEPCCICQEEYVDEEDLGTLDCGHNFHAGCIKQWLMHKNLCPICKTTALVTP